MRILWFGKDAPFLTSAYGKISDELILKRLAKHKHKIALFSSVGIEYACAEADGVTIYPRLNDLTGEDVYMDHYKDFKADLYVTAYDVWPLNKVPESARKGELTWLSWAYADWEWTDNSFIRDKLGSAFRVVPTSAWLEGALRQSGLNNVTNHIMLGVNHEVYKPFVGMKDEHNQEITKERLKQSLNFPPDSFVILMCQMNQDVRKCFDLQFEAIQLFRNANPDVNVRVWCHCLPRAPDGWMLPELAREYGIDYQKGDITFADTYTIACKGLQGYNEDYMSKLMNASDCLLHGTSGDSPGMPVLEAMSCGTPAIATDFVALHELLDPTPELRVKILRRFRPGQLPLVVRAYPDPQDMVRALTRVLNGSSDYYRKKCSEYSTRWSWDRCAAEWLKVFDDVEYELDAQCLKVLPPADSLKALATPQVFT